MDPDPNQIQSKIQQALVYYDPFYSPRFLRFVNNRTLTITTHHPQPRITPSLFVIVITLMAAASSAIKPSLLSPPPSPPPPPPPVSPLSIMNRFFGPISILSYILSLPLLVAGVWLVLTNDYDCESLLRMPHLRTIIAVGLLILFAVGNVVIYYGPRLLIPGALLLVVPLVFMLTLGLALIGAYRMESRAVPASPMWLRMRIGRTQMWENVKTCLFDSDICADLGFRTIELTSYDFSMKKLSPIESGCCKPPDLCGMQYVNATYWNAAIKKGDSVGLGTMLNVTEAAFSSFGDCHTWSNEATLLCYECDSCKLGFLVTIQPRWRRLGVFLIVMSVLLMATHLVRFILMMLERYQLMKG